MNKLIKQAFTLIELLVVIAIIGILSGLIVVSMGGMTQKATIAKAQVFSNSLRNSLMMSLVSEWKFDELTTAADGTSIQDSWNGGNNGVLDTNSIVTTDTDSKLKAETECVSDQCLYFDGVDDYISIGNPSTLKIANSGTVEFWFNEKVSPAGWIGIVVKASDYGHTQQDWGFSLSSSNIYFRSYTTNWQNRLISTPLINEWHLYGATWYYNSIDDHVYIATIYDGVLSPFTVHSYPGKFPDTKSLRIGGYSSAGYYVNGFIDTVRIYNNVIPTSQIKEQYYAGLNSLLANGSISTNEYNKRINSIAEI